MQPRVLITGASGGIGAELARLFAADGYELVLAARNLTALDALAAELRAARGVPVRTVRSDLSEPGAAERLWADAAGPDGTVDVLVNNAGVGVYGPVAEQDAEALTRMLELNVVALTALTRLALPGMLRRGSGKILNVGSVVGYQPGGPRLAAYYASKSYVLAFSRVPTTEEMSIALAHIQKNEQDPKRAYEDIVWALVNTKEFLFNH